MLKIENIEVTGWEAAIRGMRNPMNSWEKSDSDYGCEWATGDTTLCQYCDKLHKGDCCNIELDRKYIIGKNDLDLMRRLAKGGATHAKYRRMINVTMDITAPLYYLKELDTYKVGTVCNSCSTMHKIQAKEFTLDDFSCEHLFDDFAYADKMIKEYGEDAIKTDYHLSCIDVEGHTCYYTPKALLFNICQTLNRFRELYLLTNNKEYWWQMIQLLPSSYNQRRTVQLNYEVLSHIYFDRRNHKLDCWHTFCEMIEQLPYAKDIIIVGSKDAESDSEDALKKENEELKKKIEFLEGFIHSYTPGLKGV